MYEIIFDEEAAKFIEKLPKPLRERIFNKLISAKENPFYFIKIKFITLSYASNRSKIYR